MAKKNPHETKTHNYLLRSARRDSLLDIMALVHAGRVKVSGHGFPIIVKSNGTWAASCVWSVEMLENRGLVQKNTYMDGASSYQLTSLGCAALDGALTALGRRLDTAALLDQIDKRWVY